MGDGFMGLDPGQARKVAKHLKGSGEEIQAQMKDIRKYFAGVEWYGDDMKRFGGDLDTMARQTGGDATRMTEQGHVVDRRVDMQEDASR